MTEPRKTPRTDAEEFEVCVQYVGPEKFVSPDFASALEIETQELAEALQECLYYVANWESYDKDFISTEERRSKAEKFGKEALIRHNQKQAIVNSTKIQTCSKLG